MLCGKKRELVQATDFGNSFDREGKPFFGKEVKIGKPETL